MAFTIKHVKSGCLEPSGVVARSVYTTLQRAIASFGVVSGVPTPGGCVQPMRQMSTRTSNIAGAQISTRTANVADAQMLTHTVNVAGAQILTHTANVAGAQM